MKILFITNIFPPNICGVGDYTFFLCRQFVQRGDKCVVVCRKDDCQRDAVEGISVYSVVEKWNKSASKIVLGVIENEKPDIVSLQYVPHGFDAKGLPFGIIPIVHNIHKTGITPDVEVEKSDDPAVDEQLNKAMEVVAGLK